MRRSSPSLPRECRRPSRLTAAGTSSEAATSRYFQGDWAPPRFVVVEFESAEAASGWLNSEEFSPMRDLLNRSSDSDVIVMEGT